jgi:hypothetical protein
MSAPAALDQRIADPESDAVRRIATWTDFMKAMEDGSIEFRPLAPALRPIVDELPGVGRRGRRE